MVYAQSCYIGTVHRVLNACVKRMRDLRVFTCIDIVYLLAFLYTTPHTYSFDHNVHSFGKSQSFNVAFETRYTVIVLAA